MSNWKSRNDHKNVAWLPFQSWRLNTEVATDTIPPPPPLNGKNGWTMEWQELRSYFASDGVDKWLKVVGSIHFFISKSFIFKPLPAPPPPPPYQRNGVIWEVWGKKSDLWGVTVTPPKLCLWLELFIVRFTYRKRFTNQALKGITNRRINRETKNIFCRLLSCNEQALPRF